MPGEARPGYGLRPSTRLERRPMGYRRTRQAVTCSSGPRHVAAPNSSGPTAEATGRRAAAARDEASRWGAPTGTRSPAAGAQAMAGVGGGQLARWRGGRYVLVAVVAIIACWLAAVFLLRRPSHDRDWEFGFERLPSVTLADDELTIRDLRDFQVTEDGGVRAGYVDRSLHLADIERAWFVVEPFTSLPLPGFKGVAHTYFAFDVKGQPPITVSIEARRERGETFDVWSGLFNQFELMYVWATEEDTTVKRVVVQHNDLYMFPLLIPQETTVRLVRRLALTTADLERAPRFYNSFTNNCTSELAYAANSLRPGAIPLSIAWLLPEYSVDQMYDLHYIPYDRPLEDVRERHYISDLVRQTYREPDFSNRLRAFLMGGLTARSVAGTSVPSQR